MTENKYTLTRVNMNLPTPLVYKVKDYANSLGVNVTSAYIILLNTALEQKDALKDLPRLISLLNDSKKS